MTTLVDGAGTFSCAMELPVMLDEVHRQYISVVGVFRGGFAAEEVDQWVMYPNGTPRGDRELATEVLVEIWKPNRAQGRTGRHALNVADVLTLDSAAAIVVSTFSRQCPELGEGMGQGATCFVAILAFRARRFPPSARVSRSSGERSRLQLQPRRTPRRAGRGFRCEPKTARRPAAPLRSAWP
jgi:hypothetical protein